MTLEPLHADVLLRREEEEAMIHLLLITYGTLGLAQGLDAPIVEHPTVRSEIKRGYEAGGACDSYTRPADRLDDCIRDVRDRYRSTHTSTDAFEVGLNLQKWKLGARYVQVGADLRESRLAQAYAVSGRLSESQAKSEVTTLLSNLKITKEQALEAADIPSSLVPE